MFPVTSFQKKVVGNKFGLQALGNKYQVTSFRLEVSGNIYTVKGIRLRLSEKHLPGSKYKTRCMRFNKNKVTDSR